MDAIFVSPSSCLRGLLKREAELAYLVSKKFPPMWPGYAYLDVNQQALRMLDSHLIEQTEDDIYGWRTKGTPWCRRPPTLVGSGTLVVRWATGDDEDCVGHNPGRLVESWELMRLQGWGDAAWLRTAIQYFHTA